LLGGGPQQAALAQPVAQLIVREMAPGRRGQLMVAAPGECRLGSWRSNAAMAQRSRWRHPGADGPPGTPVDGGRNGEAKGSNSILAIGRYGDRVRSPRRKPRGRNGRRSVPPARLEVRPAYFS
jgi:hypothetical protein